MELMEFAGKLRSLRHAHEKNGTNIILTSSITEKRWLEFEHGMAVPNQAELKEICTALNVSEIELLPEVFDYIIMTGSCNTPENKELMKNISPVLKKVREALKLK